MRDTNTWYYSFSFVLLVFLTTGQVFCQDTAPAFIVQQGKPMPDYRFEDVTNFHSRQVSISDFKRKWLFLDFWTLGCTACVASFPKINDLQSHFKDTVSFLLVGLNSTPGNNGIRTFYEKIKRYRQLNLPTAYDSLIFKKLEIHAVPHIIIINPQGLVVAITDGRDMSKEKVQDLIRGKEVSFYPKDLDRLPFNPAISSATPLFRSVLTSWGGEDQIVYGNLEDAIKDTSAFRGGQGRGFQVSMIPLASLYNYAYTSYENWTLPNSPLYLTHYPYPVLELSDSSLFQYDYKIEVGKGLYNYSLTLPEPRLSVERVMNVLQQSLKNTFGYNVEVGERYVKVWSLVADVEAIKKLKTDGKRFEFYPVGGGSSTAAGFRMVNGTTGTLANIITRYIFDSPKLPIFDETRITDRISINMTVDMTNLNEIKKALNENGLDIVQKLKLMKVLIIRD